MKPFNLFILVLIFQANVSRAQGKFGTGARINLAAGTGFGIYSVSNNEAGKPDEGALSGNLNASLDYGLLPILTAGLTIFRNGFATDKDSSDAARVSGLGIYAHLNFARRPRATWYLNAGLGGTGFVYEKYGRRGKVTSTGGYGFAGLGVRKYFGNHVGLFGELNYVGYSFNSFSDVDDFKLKTPSGNLYQIGINGVEVRFGLVVAFGPNPD